MKITRHLVDLERVKKVYQWNQEDFEDSLQGARRNPEMLYSFLGHTGTIYIAGGVLVPDAPAVARALTLGAQAGTALFLSQRIESPPRAFVLGEGPPVVYSKPAGTSSADIITWKKAFHLCLITRQAPLSDELCRIFNDVFRHSDLVGAADADYRYADLLRAVWTAAHFTTHPAFVAEEAEYRQASGHTPWARYVRWLASPYLQVLRQLERSDATAFTAALTEALQGHKAFWSQKKNADNFEGFVSLPLTAAAALAWNRGMRFEVDSDYLPMSWVRGDCFRSPDKPLGNR
jgi:hypothetical protein